MARTNNLTNFLTDVSNAIKQKTGDNTPIPASDFDTEILSIETGGNYQSKTLNVTQNGNYNLLPDQEFDALSNVNISVSVSPVLQNKTVTENGSYSADSGYDGLGTVIVNVPQEGGSGDIKLFETEQAMQADPNPSEGDLAVVYRSDIAIPSPGDTISSITPPATVVFDTAITSSASLRLRGDNLYIDCRLTSTQFYIRDMYGTIPDYITYTSSDGITYTRTDTGAESYDLGEDVTISSTANTNILKFLQSGGMVFEGLYEYKSHIVDNTLKVHNYNGDETIIEFDITSLPIPTHFEQNSIYHYRTYFITSIQKKYTTNTGLDVYEPVDYDVFYFNYTNNAREYTYDVINVFYNDKIQPTVRKVGNSSYPCYGMFVVSCRNKVISTIDYTEEQVDAMMGANLYDYNSNQHYYKLGNYEYNTDTYIMVSNGYSQNNTLYGSVQVRNVITPPTADSTTTIAQSTDAANNMDYLLASTQLTLTNPNQLLPDIVGYGKNGLITGDGSVWNKITNTALWNNILNHTSPTSTATIYNGEINVLLNTSLPDNKLYGFVFEKPESPLATTAVINVEKHNYTNPTTEIGYYAFESPFIVNTDNYVYCFTLNYNANKMNVARYTLSNNIMLYDKSVDIAQTGLKYEHACYKYDDVNGKVYIGVYGGYPNYTTAYMFVFDIATMTITNSYSKVIGSGDGNNGTVNYIDLATNTAYLTFSYRTTTYYKWNWVNNTSGTITTYPYTNYCILPETDNATYLLYKDGNDAKIVRKSDFSTVMNITALTGKTLQSTVRPIWRNNICYLIDNKFVIKIDVDNNTCVAVDNDLTISGNYTLVGTNSYVETNDYIYFVLSYTHYSTRPTSRMIYRLNKATLALDSITANSTDFTLLFANSNHVLTTITQTFGKDIDSYYGQYDDFSYTNKLIFGYTKSMYDCNGVFALRGGNNNNVTDQGYMSSTMMDTLIVVDNNS